MSAPIIKLYSAFSTVRNEYEKIWLNIDPIVSPVDGTAIDTSKTYFEDQLQLSNTTTINTSQTLNISFNNFLVNVDASSSVIDILLPTIENVFIFITSINSTNAINIRRADNFIIKTLTFISDSINLYYKNGVWETDIYSIGLVAQSSTITFPTYSDVNVPTPDEKAALIGTSGNPSSTNKYVTDSDSRLGSGSTVLISTANVTTDMANLLNVATLQQSKGLPLFLQDNNGAADSNYGTPFYFNATTINNVWNYINWTGIGTNNTARAPFVAFVAAGCQFAAPVVQGICFAMIGNNTTASLVGGASNTTAWQIGDIYTDNSTTQSLSLLPGKYIIGRINLTTPGAGKKVILTDRADTKITTLSLNGGNIYVGSNCTLDVDICAGSASTIVIGADDALVTKVNSQVIIQNAGTYVIEVRGNNGTINISNATVTIFAGANNNIIIGSGNTITDNGTNTNVFGTNTVIKGTLDVNGTTTLTTLSTSGAATLNSASITNALTVGTTLGVTGTSTLAGVNAGATSVTTLSASGATTLNSTLNVTGSSTLAATGVTTLTASGATSLNSTLNVTGATTLSTLSTSGLATLNSINTTSITSSGNADISIIPGGTGRVLLNANPTVALGAATKQYVDNLTYLNLTGEATTSGSSVVTLTNSAVINKLLTGFVSGSGDVVPTDSILTAIQKLDGKLSGDGVANRIPYYSGTKTLTNSSNLTYNNTGTTSEIIMNTVNAGNPVLSGDNCIISGGKELLLRQTGDFYGSSGIRIRNRDGQNGVIIESINNSGINLTDLIITNNGHTRNIRLESRSGSAKAGAPSFHIGGGSGTSVQPDTPTIAIGDTIINTRNTTTLCVGDYLTNAAAKIHVTSDVANGLSNIRFTNTTTGTANTNGLQIGYNTAAFITNHQNTNMLFSTNNTLRMTIAAAGAVSINNALSVGTTLNVTGATTLSTLTTSGLATLNSLSVTNNATINGTLGAGASTLSSAIVSGTLSAGASTLNSLSVTNNATINGTLGVTGNTSLSTLSTSGLATLNSVNTTSIVSSGNVDINILPGGTGRVLLNADPLANLNASTKQYVDYIPYKKACKVRSTGLTGSATGSGPTKTITASPAAVMPQIDGITMIVGDRILYDTGDGNAGIYVVSQITSPWIITRANDADDINKLQAGTTIYIQQGTTNAGRIYTLSTNITTIETTPLIFTNNTVSNNHSALINLNADDHTQYALLDGRNGGQTLIGSTIANQNLTLTANSANIANGSIVINTTTPSTTTTSGALTVAGGVGVAGAVNSATITTTGLATLNSVVVSGTLSAGATTLDSLSVTNNATVSGTLGAGATSVTTLNASGAATLGSTLNVTGDTTLGSTLSAGASTLSSAVVSGTFSAGASTLNSLNVTNNTTIGGTLGAGSTTVTTLNASGATTLGSTLNVTGAATLGSTLNVTNATTLAGATVQNDLTIGGKVLLPAQTNSTQTPNFVIPANNRITFGETFYPPSDTGTVISFASGSSTRNMLFAFGKTGINTSFFGNDGVNMVLGTEGTAPMVFKTGLTYSSTNVLGTGTEAMRINSAGSLIIPTTTTALTSTTGGALRVAGGISVGANVIIGTTLSAGATTLDSLNVTNATILSSTLSAGASTLNSLNVTNTSTLAGAVSITNTTPSSTTVTGALIISGTGGLGVGGNTNIGGSLTANSAIITTTLSAGATTLNSLSVTNNTTMNTVNVTGSLRGNAGAGTNLTIQANSIDTTGSIIIPTTTVSATSTTGGALRVAGGISVGANVIIGTTLNVVGATTLAATNVTTFSASGATTLSSTLSAGASTLSSAVVSGTLSAGATTLNSLSVTNNATIGGTLGAGASTLNSLSVTNNSTLNGTLNVTGNTSLSTLSTSGLASLNSANVSNAVSIGTTLNVTGSTSLSTLSTSGLATLNSISVSGNASVNGSLTVTNNTTLNGGLNVTAVVATGTSTLAAVTATTLNTSGLASLNSISTTSIVSNGNANISILPNGTGRVLLNADPSVNLGASTKQYVDYIPSKKSCKVRSTGLTGTASAGPGPGRIITANPAAAMPQIDGITMVVGDRILYDTGNANAGIYVVTQITSPWIITRANDADDGNKLQAGSTVYIQQGTVNAGRVYTLSTTGTITIDTTSLIFTNATTSNDHSTLTNLLVDSHTQYALLAGRSGGQTLIGSTLANQNLTFTANSANIGTGSIVINTTTPSTNTSNGALTVGGGLGVGGAINSATLSTTGAASLNSLTVTNTASLSSVTVSSTLGVTSNATIGGTLGVTSNATVGGTLGVTGATTLSSTLSAGASTLSSAIVSGTLSAGATTLNSLNVTNATTLAGAVSITNTTVSSTTGTGALVIAGTGGLGVGGAINSATLSTTGAATLNSAVITTTASIGGVVSITNNTTSSTTGTGALVVTGGIGVGGAMTIGGAVNITNTTVSTNTVSGALRVGGGLGVVGAVNSATLTTTGLATLNAVTVGTTLDVTGATTLSTLSTSGLATLNSVSITNNLTINTANVTGSIRGGTASGNNLTLQANSSNTTTGSVIINNSTASTSSTTGSLTVNGGVGIAGATFTGGNITVNAGNGVVNATTINGNTELILQQTGDTAGTSSIRIRNRFGENGLIIENNTGAVTDLILRAANGGTIQRNIRIETRGSGLAKANVNCFHIGGTDPDNPTLAIGDTAITTRSDVNLIVGGYLTAVTAASSKIHVTDSAAGTSNIRFTNTNSGITATDGLEIGYGTNAFINNRENTDMIISTNNTTAMTIEAATNRVAVAGAPTADLHVSTKQYVDFYPRRITYIKTGTDQDNFTNTLAAVTGLNALPLPNVGTYKITGVIYATAGNANPDLVLVFSVGTSTVSRVKIGVFAYGAAGSLLTQGTLSLAYTTASIPLNTTLTTIQLDCTLTITGTVPGTFNTSFRQNSANAARTTILTDSYIQIEQIA